MHVARIVDRRVAMSGKVDDLRIVHQDGDQLFLAPVVTAIYCAVDMGVLEEENRFIGIVVKGLLQFVKRVFLLGFAVISTFFRRNRNKVIPLDNQVHVRVHVEQPLHAFVGLCYSAAIFVAGDRDQRLRPWVQVCFKHFLEIKHFLLSSAVGKVAVDYNGVDFFIVTARCVSICCFHAGIQPGQFNAVLIFLHVHVAHYHKTQNCFCHMINLRLKL